MALFGTLTGIPRMGGGGIAAPPPGGMPAEEQMAQRAAAQTAANAAQKQQQDDLNKAEDRNRSIQKERDMAAANRQNAVNAGGTASGEYGYAYPVGGGGRGMEIGGGMFAAPNPRQAPQPAQSSDSFDASALASLRAQMQPPPVAPIAPPNNGVADQAFARAKDKTGLLALRRLADSRAQFGQRGMTGSGVEAGVMDSILGDASSGLQDFALGQAQTEADRSYQVADRNYAGALQQRGQDISLTPILLDMLRRSGRAY